MLVLLLACWLVLPGCASYSYSFHSVERAIADGQPDQALAMLEKLHEQQSFFNKADLLYYLNKAMVLRMQHQYLESGQAFERAKALIEQYDAFSLTEQAGSFIINDATRAYVGEPFEQVLLHLFAALNYLELDQPFEARVEALQVDQRLSQLNAKIQNPVYTEDAFARYLTGIIYEQLGEYSDAMIACRKAYEAYRNYESLFGVRAPKSLQEALLRLSAQQGLDDEYRRYREEFGVAESEDVYRRRDSGELVIVLSSGLAPVKRENGVTTIAPGSGQVVRVAVPYYVARSDDLGGMEVLAKNRQSGAQVSARGELVQNIDNIAFKSLEARMPAIVARSAARAVTKYQITREMSRQDNALGILSNVLNVVTERADTRSWLTLPKAIYLLRLSLEPGVYDVDLSFLSNYGTPLKTQILSDIEITAGQTRYITPHRVPTQALREP